MINAPTSDASAFTKNSLRVDPLPAFSDNYLWLLRRDGLAAVVDPGDADVVLAALEARKLRLAAILVTHHHPDHIGGVSALLAKYDVPVFGPRAEAQRIPELTHLLDEADVVDLASLNLELKVMTVPGHTRGHIAFHAPRQGWLFCGDTLFAAGCGRLFEGTPAQMHDSLQKLAGLPPETQVFCAHEYTLANLAFANAVEPGNPAIVAEIERVQALRAAQQPSVPSSIGRERRVNPFLRCGERGLATRVEAHAGLALADETAVFAALRLWKDSFRGSV